MLTWFQRNAAVILTMVGLIGFATSAAQAQTYKFTFTAGSLTGVISFTGTTSGSNFNVAGASGTIGTSSVSLVTNYTNWGSAPQLLTPTTAPYFARSSSAGANTVVVLAGGTYYRFSSSSSTFSPRDRVATSTSSGGNWSGNTNLTNETLTVPSPVPGAGWPAWLLLVAFSLYSQRGKLTIWLWPQFGRVRRNVFVRNPLSTRKDGFRAA